MATVEEFDSIILESHENRENAADSWLTTTAALVTDVRQAIIDGVGALIALGITIDVSDVDTTYVTPTAPATLDPSTVLIGDAEWNRILNQAAAIQQAAAVAEEYTAASEAASRGLAIPSFISEMHVAGAQQRAMDRVSALAMTTAVEHAKAQREDIPKAQELNLDRYGKQIASEQARLQYETLELDKAIKPEQLRAEFDLKKTDLALVNVNRELIDLIQVYAQITQALISGSNVGLSTSIARSLGQIVYNPTLGQVVRYPA
jgi:hypothetical protein